MAIIPGTIGLTGAIAPNDSTDTYPTHYAKYGSGGYYSVASINERDNISSERKEEGLLVYVLANDTPYIWKKGDWSIFLPPLEAAASGTLGGVKIGSGISVTSDGTISSFKYTNRIYVSPQGSDSNDGRSPETAKKTIKAAARLANETTEVESIYVGTGEFAEDNPIYLPPGTAVIGDNLRRTIVKPLNEGRDFFWWSSGCYVNYLVFQDNYLGGVGKLDTSTQANDRELPVDAVTFKLFPGHTLKRLPGVYKDGAGLILAQKSIANTGIVDTTYTYLTTPIANGGAEYTIPITKTATCRRDIGYFVDAILEDLKAGGNVNSINCGKSYRDANRDLISSMTPTEITVTKAAFLKAKDLCKIAIMNVPSGYVTGYPTTGQSIVYNSVDTSSTKMAACTEVDTTIENLYQIIISLIDGGDVPEYNSGSNYILIDQEWIKVLDLNLTTDTITVESRGVANRIPTNNLPPFLYDSSTAAKHINGAVVSQAGRAFRYAVAFPDQSGYWGKGRISISTAGTGNLAVSTVTGSNTKFTTETFVGWSLKVGSNSYTIKSINSDTSITLVAPANNITAKAYKIVPAKEQIFLSPYIQNCSNISVLGKAYFDVVTQSYDADKTRAGGMLVDNNQLDAKTPIPSNVADAFTQIAFGGIGFHHKNDAYSQLVSVFQVFDGVGILCESGAYTSVTNSATNFGDLGLVAIGYSDKAAPSFKGATVNSIENSTKTNFNTTSTNIRASIFTAEGTKTKATITVSPEDFSKFEVGQTLTIAGHNSTPAINGTNKITGTNLSNKTIEIVLNTAFPNTIVDGAATGTITISSGKLETKVTVNGFKETPLVNYVVKIKSSLGADLLTHPSGIEYIVNEVTSELFENNCIFTLQQVVPQADLANLALKAIELRAPSTVNSSGHTFEYVGSGINYTALPINGGQTNKNNQTVEINSGNCYVSGTDQDGNFTVGSYFNVDLRSGRVTFAGQLSLGVVDALELKESPGVSINEFATDMRIRSEAKNTTLPTEKAVKDYIATNLGSFINIGYTTGAGAGSGNQLVMLNANGYINPDAIQLPPAEVLSAANQAERLDLNAQRILQNKAPLKTGDFVTQLDNLKRYILKTPPGTADSDWQVFSTDTFTADSITSGQFSANRIATATPDNPANDTRFASGGGNWLPAVTSLKTPLSSAIKIEQELSTTTVSSTTGGRAGAIEIDVTKAAFSNGASSSTIGVAGFNNLDFEISGGSIVSIKNKLSSADSPLVFGTNGILSIQKASATQNGYLSSGDWDTFNKKEAAITAGTATQYWTGNKTWATLSTSVLATTLTGYASGTDAVISSTDTLLEALQKLQAQIEAANNTAFNNSLAFSIALG